MSDITHIAKLKSEIDLNKSIADKNRAEAKRTEGTQTELDKAQTAKHYEEINTEKGKQALMAIEKNGIDLDNQLKTANFEESKKLLQKQVEETTEIVRKLHTEANITEQTAEDIISRAKAEALRTWLENDLKRANISREKQSIMLDKWKVNIEQCLANENIRIADMDLAIKAFANDIKTFYPTSSQILGHLGAHFLGNTSKEDIQKGVSGHNKKEPQQFAPPRIIFRAN